MCDNLVTFSILFFSDDEGEKKDNDGKLYINVNGGVLTI